MTNGFKTAISAAIFATTLAAQTPAQAAVIMRTFSVDAADLVPLAGGGVTGIRVRQALNITGFTPFSLAVGDILETTINFTSPVEMRDTGPGGLTGVLEFGGGVYSSSTPFSGSYESSKTGLVSTLFSPSGDFLGDPLPNSGGNTTADEIAITQTWAGNITASEMFFTGMFLRTEVTFLEDDSVTFDTFRVFLTDDHVPAPGALALLGFGLLGLSLRRRRAA